MLTTELTKEAMIGLCAGVDCAFPPAPGEVPPAAGLTALLTGAGPASEGEAGDDGAALLGCPPPLTEPPCSGAVVIVLADPAITVETKADSIVLAGIEPAPFVPACGEVGGVVRDSEVVVALAAHAALELAAAAEADELDK